MIAWVILISASLCYVITLTLSISQIRLRLTSWFPLRIRLFRALSTMHDTVVHTLPDAVFLLNQYHTVVAANDAAVQLTNSTDPLGQPIARVLPHIPSVHEYCATKEIIRFETECNNPAPAFYETTITPLFGTYGQTTGCLLLLRDITEQRLMHLRQQVLVEVGALLSSPTSAELPFHDVTQVVAEHLVHACAVYLKDTDGQVHIFGASSHPAVALPYDGEDALDVANVWKPVMEGAKRILYEASHDELLTSGSAKADRYLSQLRSVICIPLQSQEHTYGALLIATRDGGRELGTNDIALADAVAQRIAGALESQHLFAALQVSESRFRAASIAAEQVSTAKSTFLTMMSHEIRTPLMGVLGIADLLSRTNIQTDQHELLNILVRNGHSLRTTITDILDISKIEAGKLDLVKEPVDLIQCIEDAVSTVAFQASEKGLELTYRIDTDVPGVVSTDYVRLRQILMNLLSNAVKFTDNGSVTIHVMSTHFGSSTYGAENICFTVHDTGSGIAPEHCEHLFDAFYQGAKQNYDGSGVGLTISKHLCELMGGTMRVVSRLGEGSTFSFTLAAESLIDVQPKMPLSAVPLLDGKCMLLVGMSDATLATLAIQAQTWGMHVRTVETIEEALCILRSDIRHDVIVVGSRIVQEAPQVIAEMHQLAATEPEQPIITLLPLTHIWDETYVVPDNLVVQICPLKLSTFYETLMRLTQLPAGPFDHIPINPVAVPEASLRMLIVDDNETNCMLMEHMLGTLGYRADVVTSGEAALRALRRSPYDVVWLDVHLTGGVMDGLEVAQQFRNMQNVKIPYIVAVTGSATVQDRVRCLDAGMHDYLCKPIEQDQLEQVIARACAWPRQVATLAVHVPDTLAEMLTFSMYQAIKPEEQSISNQHLSNKAVIKTPAGYMLPEVIVATFFEEAHEMLLAMRCAVDSGNNEKLSAILHRLKSSSWYIAGESMMQACQLFEDLARLGDSVHWDEAMFEVEKSLAEAYQAVNGADSAGRFLLNKSTVVPHAQALALVSGD